MAGGRLAGKVRSSPARARLGVGMTGVRYPWP